MASGTVKWTKKKLEINAKKAEIDEAMYRGARLNGGLNNNGYARAQMLGVDSTAADIAEAMYPKKIHPA